ncbi:eotaxin-like [Discoglossus pictus]
MSMWTLLPLLLALLLCSSVYMQGAGHTAIDCCFQTSDKGIPLNTLKGYEIQSMSEGCPTNAVVFITKTSKKLCSTPGLPWVKKLIVKLDKKIKKDNNRKDKKGKKLSQKISS